MEKYVYSFGGGQAEGQGNMKDVLGGKGAGLAEMTNAGLPVPPGFTIATSACRVYFENGNQLPDAIRQEVDQALARLEQLLGQRLGDAESPLLVSVRSGAKFSMPGMMDTILKLGMNDTVAEAIARKTGNPRFAYDSYRRFIQMFGNVVQEISKEEFDHIFNAQKKRRGVKQDTELTAQDLQQIIAGYKKLVQKKTGKEFPQDPRQQLAMAIEAVFRSWNNPRAQTYRRLNKIPDDLGTAVNVQAMVFGNMGETSGTGVGFTRNPATGEKQFYGEFLMNAQGEDVVAGVRTPVPIQELQNIMPEVYNQSREITARLERHYKDVQDFEFTSQEGKLYMLQTRNGKRTGNAAVRIAVDMVEEGLLTQKEALMRVEPEQLDQLLHPVLDESKPLNVIATGLPASPGAAVGRVVFTADDAVAKGKNGPVILVRAETVPDDIHGMEVAQGILTSRGGMTSHAAVVTRGMGKCCVAGAGDCEVDARKREMRVGKLVVKEGDWISLDGSTGRVVLGQTNTVEPDTSSGDLAEFMKWADKYRRLGVRANADIPRDALAARRFGAEGIGLCRTEHMFFAQDRLPHVQRMIMACKDTADPKEAQRLEKERRAALAKLLPMQRKDFVGLFKAMDGLPVIIRTLDPPLPEFLPKREELLVDIAILPYADAKAKKSLIAKYSRFKVAGAADLKKVLPTLLKRVEDLHEFNPMLGFRGCRLGIRYPEITEMQARAIFEAVVQVAKKGVKVVPEVMIPLVGFEKEFEMQRDIVDRVAKEVLAAAGLSEQKYLIGTMIEIVRGAMTAEEIARNAEFFSLDRKST